ncbi:Acyl- -binding domain-containing 5, partial [Paramuricea clavata]
MTKRNRKTMADSQRKFDAAVHVIRSLPKSGSFQPSHGMMLKFYGYYKQAKEGPCNEVKPSFWDVVNKAK